MSKYTYNENLVNEALDQLYSACDAIENTNVEMEKGISTILNARGAENLDIDFTVITNYQSQVIEYIETIGADIKKKQEEIEDYQNAPWYKKLFMTLSMGALKIVEGLGTFVEQIGDGLVSVAGFIGGIFSSEFKDSCAEFVKKDHVGDAFYNAYETGCLQDVNKYSVMSHQSTAANILKGVGTAAGYVILSVATAGAGTAVSLGVSTAAAAAGGIGSGTQTGLQQGKDFNQAFVQGVKQGAVAAATNVAAMGVAKAASGLRAGAGLIDDATNAASKGGILSKAANKASAIWKHGDEIMAAGNDVVDDLILNGSKGAQNIQNASKIISKTATLSSKVPVVGKYASKVIGAVGTNAYAATAATALGTAVNVKNQMDNVNTSNAYRQANIQAANISTNSEEIFEDETTDDQIDNNTPTPDTQIDNNTPTPNTQIDNNPTPDDQPNNTTTTPDNYTPTTTPITTTTPTNNTQTTTTPPQQVEAEKVTLPSTNTTDNTSTTTPTTNTETNTSTSISTDDIVSSVSPGNNYSNPTYGHSASGDSYETDALVEESGLEETSTDVTLEEDSLLNATGNVSGSLSGLTSGNSVNIPTSSSPLISTNKTSGGNSVIPLAAGLGAASIAGLGTKVVLDKKENKDNEETDEVTAEEWSGEDTFEVDYEESDGSDYLSPTDEYAYQEEPQESYQAINSSELASMQ